MIQTRTFWSLAVATLLMACGSGSPTGNNPISLVDSNSSTGYGIYRSGQPTASDLKTWCAAGGRTIFALNGKASEYQASLEQFCPQASVVYDVEQNPDVAVSGAFLQAFDAEVQKAQSQGYAILFHCNCGCHRTGRLAAYYRMKYNGWTADQAIDEMNRIGKDMNQHPTLPQQVKAMEDYIHQRTCTQNTALCIQ